MPDIAENEQSLQGQAELLPKFGSESPETEEKKMELWKAAVSSEYGWVRNTAISRMKPFFEVSDTDDILAKKEELYRYCIMGDETSENLIKRGKTWMDVRRNVLSEIGYEFGDSDKVRELKKGLFELAIKKADEVKDEVMKRMAEEKLKEEPKENDAVKFMEGLLKIGK